MGDAQPPSEHPGAITLHLFGRTDVGQIREHNEDNFLVANLTQRTRGLMREDRTQLVGPHGTVLGVCDGMGGAAAGEVASQLAVDTIYERLAAGPPPKSPEDLAQRLVQAVDEAGTRIFEAARADRTRRGMGTTATIAALVDSRLFVAQVGDSRAYLLRGQEFVQITRDQSLVNQLIEAGQLTEEEAETFEHNNIILQALGTAETVQVDLTYVDLCQGDVLMLCSDGLSGMLRASEVREILLSTADPLESCKELTERANLAGGHDNITVVIARFEGGGLKPADESTPALAYRKFALPDPFDAKATAPGLPSVGQGQAPTSEEARKEQRQLRVGHTMVGFVASPDDEDDKDDKDGSRAGTAQDRRTAAREDAVQLPISGLPPPIVGILVLGAMVFVAVTGFFLLR